MGQYSNIHIVETRTKPKEKKKNIQISVTSDQYN